MAQIDRVWTIQWWESKDCFVGQVLVFQRGHGLGWWFVERGSRKPNDATRQGVSAKKRSPSPRAIGDRALQEEASTALNTFDFALLLFRFASADHYCQLLTL